MYFGQFQLPLNADGTVPSYIAGYKYYDPNNAGSSVRFWYQGWKDLVFGKIKEAISNGFNGIFLDDIGKTNNFKPNNPFGNEIVADIDDKMADFVSEIRAFLTSISNGEKTYLVGNDPIGILMSSPQVAKNFDAVLNEGGINSRSVDLSHMYPDLSTSEALKKVVENYQQFGVTVLGHDWFANKLEILKLIKDLDVYSNLGVVTSYQIGFQGPDLLKYGPLVLTATEDNQVLSGTSNLPFIYSSGIKLNSTFSSGSNNDQFKVNKNVTSIIDSGGIDTAWFDVPFSAVKFQFTSTSDSTVTYKTNELTRLHDIERLIFSDKSIAIDINGNAGTTAKILGAVFGKDSLSNKQYVGIGLSLLDAGMSTTTLASLAVDAANLKTNDQIVSTLWKNVFGTTASISDKAPYIKLLDDGMTPGTLAWLAADTTFNKVNINLVGLAQTGIEYIPVS
ncbi:MAG: hypothetical protein EBT78_18025 [Betaproteobacteria bacterium]|nr:hypothetical protein [Betaproteobacteria bacterium]NBT69650.1 hypothetical protein [Betaproteobacteria bacterium]